jgi:hypothetical protein
MDIAKPISLALIALAVPFVVGLLAARAWRWRGIATAMATGPVVAVLMSLSRATLRGSAMDFPAIVVSAIYITEVWLYASIPGAIIGLAVSAIADRRRRVDSKSGHCGN